MFPNQKQSCFRIRKNHVTYSGANHVSKSETIMFPIQKQSCFLIRDNHVTYSGTNHGTVSETIMFQKQGQFAKLDQKSPCHFIIFVVISVFLI